MENLFRQTGFKVYKSPRNDAEPLVLESRTRISGCHGLKRLVTPLRCSVLSHDVHNFSFQKFSAAAMCCFGFLAVLFHARAASEVLQGVEN